MASIDGSAPTGWLPVGPDQGLVPRHRRRISGAHPAVVVVRLLAKVVVVALAVLVLLPAAIAAQAAAAL